MSELVSVLSRHFGGPRKLGDASSDALIADMRDLADDLNRTWWVRASMIIGVFIIELILFVIYHENATVVAGLFAAAGLTIGGAVSAMQTVTQEMARVRMLISVLPSLTPETLEELARKLIEKL